MRQFRNSRRHYSRVWGAVDGQTVSEALAHLHSLPR